MALAATEKYEIVRLLGWPAAVLDPTSLSYSKILSDRLDRFPVDAEPMLRTLLERVKELDDKLVKSVGRAGVKRIDDIEFFGDSNGSPEMVVLRNERNRLLREIAALMDIAFGAGYSGGRTGCVVV